ncbi:MAG: hypothetical protein R3F20_18985 [Planctomycetota bacterium]
MPTDGGGHTRVYLTPALRFVATINTDHTTRRLYRAFSTVRR